MDATRLTDAPTVTPLSVVGGTPQNTSLVTVLSSDHGRMRRLQRGIQKRDLQAAVKYGKREPANPCPRTGERRWKFTYADIVYITDDSCKREITEYPSARPPPPSVAPVEITPEQKDRHARVKAMLHADDGSWNSHTVAIVDNSGSMRTQDASIAGTSRADAVWTMMASSLIKDQLERRGAAAAERDVVSIVLMGETAELLVDREPLDWLLYNKVVRMLRSAEPKKARRVAKHVAQRLRCDARGDSPALLSQHHALSSPVSFLRLLSLHQEGNYLPALEMAERLLLSNTRGSCALVLMFFSDGRPSDSLPKGKGLGSVFDRLSTLAGDRVAEMAKRFGRRLTVGTVGFNSNSTEDFAVLRKMVVACEEYGARGLFQNPEWDGESLRLAMGTLTQV